MPKFLFFLFLVMICSPGQAQNSQRVWSGGGYYGLDDPMLTIMKKMGALKPIGIVFSNKVNGSGMLQTLFNKTTASLPTEDSNQTYTIAAEYNEQQKELLLIVTHIKTDTSRSPMGETFKRPDSVYYDLVFKKESNKLIITGNANKRNRNTNSEWVGSTKGAGMGMNIQDKISMHILPLHIRLEELQIPDEIASAPAAPRKKEIQQTIILDTTLITIDMYDNGTIDGDTATLILDGKIIVDKQLLGLQFSRLTIDLSKSPGKEHLLELFANNLGTIPPNTALVVLYCNRKRYEINLSSTESTNGTVRLKFKN